MLHITILRSRPAVEGAGRQETKWAGEYKKGKAKRTRGQKKGKGEVKTRETNI